MKSFKEQADELIKDYKDSLKPYYDVELKVIEILKITTLIQSGEYFLEIFKESSSLVKHSSDTGYGLRIRFKNFIIPEIEDSIKKLKEAIK